MTEQLEQSIRKKFKHQPTKDQDLAIRTFPRFMQTAPSENPLFILKGYAGTGKTSLVAAWIQSLKEAGVNSVLMAPTGRAAKVLSNHSNQEAYTIHRRIYTHKRTGDKVVVERAINTEKNTIFFIDEASMIGIDGGIEDGLVKGGNLLEDLIEYVYQGKGCKMVFIGDSFQLPPVGWDESPATDEAYLKENFSLKIGTVNLKQVVRQERASNILHNATRLRKNPDTPPLLTPGKDLIAINGDELAQQIEAAYDEYGSESVVVLTRSNKNANLYNNQIRSRILWYEDALVKNDRIMVVKNNYYWLKKKDKMGFIANGDMGNIIKINHTFERYETKFAEAEVVFKDDPEEKEHKVLLLLETLQEEGPSLSREKQKALFYAIEEDFIETRSKGKRFEKIFSTPEFNALQIKFAYAVTCHKAQGGQWPVVFIDHGWISEEQIDISFNRWLYTALTRATEKVFLVNFSPRFIGN